MKRDNKVLFMYASNPDMLAIQVQEEKQEQQIAKQRLLTSRTLLQCLEDVKN